MLENNKIIDDIREDLLDRLNDYEGVKTNIYDLGFLLSENENGTGSVFCNTYKTINYLAENYYDVAEIVSELGDDSNMIDPAIFFDSPETFHVQIFVTVADYLINCIDFSEYDNDDNDGEFDPFDPDDFELTSDVIEFIKENI